MGIRYSALTGIAAGWLAATQPAIAEEPKRAEPRHSITATHEFGDWEGYNASYSGLEVLLNTPYGSFGGFYEKGIGETMLNERASNVFGPDITLPGKRAIQDRWMVNYSIDDSDLKLGFPWGVSVGYSELNRESEDFGAPGSAERMNKTLFARGYLFSPEGLGISASLVVTVDYKDAVFRIRQEEISYLKNLYLKPTFPLSQNLDISGVLDVSSVYRVSGLYVDGKTAVLPPITEFETTQYTFGPTIRYSPTGDMENNSLEIGAFLIRGGPSFTYHWLNGTYDDTFFSRQNESGEFGALSLNRGFGLSMDLQQPTFSLYTEFRFRDSSTKDSFPIPPMGILTVPADRIFDQQREEIILRAVLGMKDFPGDPWYENMKLEFTYRNVENTGKFNLVAPSLSSLGQDPLLFSQITENNQQWYGLGIEKKINNDFSIGARILHDTKRGNTLGLLTLKKTF